MPRIFQWCVDQNLKTCKVRTLFLNKWLLTKSELVFTTVFREAETGGKHLRQSLFFNKVAGLKPCNFFEKEILPHVFSCEFCKIFKNTF